MNRGNCFILFSRKEDVGKMGENNSWTKVQSENLKTEHRWKPVDIIKGIQI